MIDRGIDNDKTFESFKGHIFPALKKKMQEKISKNFSQKITKLKITAGPLPACPKDHPGYGDTGWLFFDELVVR